jgi:Flp pilus assembly protein TadG
MKAIQKTKRRRRGFVLIYYSLCLMLILPIVGLAIDLGMLYNVKAKLAAAIDGASLAGGRCLSRGIAFADSQAVAKETATRFFWANFPQGYWGAKVAADSPKVTVGQGTNQLTVQISASVQSPLMFMRIFDYPTSTVAASAIAVRRDINMVLVLDRSKSIVDAGADGKVRSSSISFVGRMIQDSDMVGLISFSGNVRLHFAPKTVFKDDATAAISALVFNGNTNSSAGLSEAYTMIKNLNQPGALNVIVFFTDGRPTALTADLPVAGAPYDRYGLPSKDNGYNNETSTVRTYYKSTCTATDYITAFISAPGGWPPNPTGWTWALGKPIWTTSSDTDDTFADDTGTLHNANGCLSKSKGVAYRVGYTDYKTDGSTADGRADVAYVPNYDHYGNRMDSGTGYKSPDVFSSGTWSGKIRPDSTRAIRYAAYNAVDSCAKRIRADTTLNPVVFTIGLGGTGSETLDDVLLERLANDRRSPIYDSSRPEGLFALAANDTELDGAFDKVASQILRLAE